MRIRDGFSDHNASTAKHDAMPTQGQATAIHDTPSQQPFGSMQTNIEHDRHSTLGTNSKRTVSNEARIRPHSPRHAQQESQA